MKTIQFVSCFILMLILLSRCGAPEKQSKEVTDITEDRKLTNVSVISLESETLEDLLRLSGRLEPWLEVEVSTELGGTVQGIEFEKGFNVSKGKVLARIGTDLLEASFAEAAAELEQAKFEFNKMTNLFVRKAVSKQELTMATSTFHRSQARVKQAKLRVERSVVRAPSAGIAIRREIEMGEVLPAGSLITTIHQVSRLKAVVGIPENDISFFSKGVSAKISVDAYPEREFQGQLYYLSSVASDKNRTFSAEVAIDNRDLVLKPGMMARVHLIKEVFENTIVVPRDSVVERDNGSITFVFQAGRAEVRKVLVGSSEAGEVVVLGGLKIGDKLIVSGHRNLVDGQPVRVVKRKSS